MGSIAFLMMIMLAIVYPITVKVCSERYFSFCYDMRNLGTFKRVFRRLFLNQYNYGKFTYQCAVD